MRGLCKSKLLIGLMLTGFITSNAQARNDVTGVWFDASGKGAVELFHCARSICGRIVWLKRSLGKSGRPVRDIYNPSSQLRQRPICGLQMISGVRPLADGSWDGGQIYDPKVGKSYDVAIERLGARKLRITGYRGVRLFGKSFVWSRAPADIKRCKTEG